MEVRYVPYAIANRFETHIELNENLRYYPDLHNAILQHELQHTNEKGFNKKDAILDFGVNKVNYFKLFKFMCIYPKTFLQFAPIYKKGDTLFYDLNLCLVWSFILGFASLGIYLWLA